MPLAPVLASDNDVQELEAQLTAVQDYLALLMGEAVTKQPMSSEEMHEVVGNGIEWLLRAQEENGHFKYEYVPYEDRYLEADNIVRQGGALFILGEVYRRQQEKDPRIEGGIQKAVDYFEGISIAGEENGIAFRCVANSEHSKQCKLGATALVLSGILGYVEDEEQVPVRYLKLIVDYTNYILSAQKEEGGFSNVYSSIKGFLPEESSFSNGEALLALTRLYQYEGSKQLRTAIDAAFAYLERTPYDTGLYLWIMAALKDMQTLWPNDAYVKYARDFTAWRIAGVPAVPTGKNYCAYIEGVASAYSVLSTNPQPGELARLHTILDVWNTFHTSLQLTGENRYRVVTNSQDILSLGYLAAPQQARGGFLTARDTPTQRIDFTQHCISSYAQTLVEVDGGSL